MVQEDEEEDTTVGGEEADQLEDEEAQSQGTVSLLDISTSDNKEVRKSTVHESACKSNVQYGNWWNEQVCQGNEGIAKCDKQVNDYMDGCRPSKAPDKIGPPLFYMEEHWVFIPLDSIANPLGLCRFYQTDPQKSNVVMGAKSAAAACRIKHWLELAKESPSNHHSVQGRHNNTIRPPSEAPFVLDTVMHSDQYTR